MQLYLLQCNVQLPILQRLSLGILIIQAIQSNELELDPSDFFVENTMSVPKRKRSNELKMLHFVEAVGLSRLGNQMGSKHGCVIFIP